MIKEAYVSFEVAKLLKEKGFDVYSNTYYTNDGMLNSDVYGNTVNFCCEAPTHQMAMAWLREKHNIDIDINAEVRMLAIKVYLPMISTYKSVTDNPGKLRQYKRGLYYKDYRNKEVIPGLQYYDSYEEAVEAALKYCLENLI